MKNKKRVLQAISMVTQIGLSVLVPVALCVAFGLWLDSVFETNFIMIIFMVLGFAAALRNVIILVRAFYHRDMILEHKRLEEEARLKAAFDAEKEARKKEREEAFQEWKRTAGGKDAVSSQS